MLLILFSSVKIFFIMKMKYPAVCLLLLLSLVEVAAQANKVDELKVKNNDHRIEKTVFEVFSHEKNRKIALFSTGADQYFFEIEEPNKRVKVSSQFAEKANVNFIQKFIDMKYGMKAYTKKCNRAFTLLMSGEKQLICSQEASKVEEVAKIIKNLKRDLKKLK